MGRESVLGVMIQTKIEKLEARFSSIHPFSFIHKTRYYNRPGCKIYEHFTFFSIKTNTKRTKTTKIWLGEGKRSLPVHLPTKTPMKISHSIVSQCIRIFHEKEIKMGFYIFLYSQRKMNFMYPLLFQRCWHLLSYALLRSQCHPFNHLCETRLDWKTCAINISNTRKTTKRIKLIYYLSLLLCPANELRNEWTSEPARTNKTNYSIYIYINV